MTTKLMGQKVQRVEDQRFLRGQGRYVDDVAVGGDVLHAAVLRSPHAHARIVDIDGCQYREGLSAVRIDGGVAGNVIPDAASVTVNFRFAPDRTVAEALAHVHDVFDGLDVDVQMTDAAAGALPAQFDARFIDLWRYYLMYCEGGFRGEA